MGQVCGGEKGAADKLEVETVGEAKVPPANRRRSGVSAEVPGSSGAKASKFPKSDEDREWLKKVLSGIIIFEGTGEETMNEVIDVMRKEVVKKAGHKIIEQGSLAADYFYIIESGECDIYKYDEEDPKRESKYLATIGKEKYFGELALMYNAPRAATVQAKKQCVLWKLDRGTFQRVRIDLRAKQLADAETFLKEVPFLKPMSKNNICHLADVLQPQYFEPDQRIITKGETGERMYILEKGEAFASVTKDDKSVEKVKSYKRGDYFGELALLNEAPRAADVTAKTKCTVLSLDKQGFDRLLGDVKGHLKKQAKTYPQLFDEYVGDRRKSKST